MQRVKKSAIVQLAQNGRTVLFIHHVRKSGGEHGTASRKSGATESVKRREENEDDRRTKLRECLLTILPEGDGSVALTREEIWDQVPEEIRRNVKRFEAVLEDGCGELWAKKPGSSRIPARYWRSLVS